MEWPYRKSFTTQKDFKLRYIKIKQGLEQFTGN